jgi:hypothetical protein
MKGFFTTAEITAIFNERNKAERTATSVSKILSRSGLGEIVGTIRLIPAKQLDAAMAAIAAAKRGNPLMGAGQPKQYRQSPGRPRAEPTSKTILKKVKKKG